MSSGDNKSKSYSLETTDRKTRSQTRISGEELLPGLTVSCKPREKKSTEEAGGETASTSAP